VKFSLHTDTVVHSTVVYWAFVVLITNSFISAVDFFVSFINSTHTTLGTSVAFCILNFLFSVTTYLQVYCSRYRYSLRFCCWRRFTIPSTIAFYRYITIRYVRSSPFVVVRYTTISILHRWCIPFLPLDSTWFSILPIRYRYRLFCIFYRYSTTFSLFGPHWARFPGGRAVIFSYRWWSFRHWHYHWFSVPFLRFTCTGRLPATARTYRFCSRSATRHTNGLVSLLVCRFTTLVPFIPIHYLWMFWFPACCTRFSRSTCLLVTGSPAVVSVGWMLELPTTAFRSCL